MSYSGSAGLLNGASTAMYGASAVASIVGSKINYDLMKVQNRNIGIQANQIELQAQQELNQYRQQFINNVSQLQYNATRRGIKQSSGSLQDNLEQSAKNLGEDFNTIKTNVELQANTLRSQQKINKRINKANLYSGIVGSILGSGASLYSNNLLSNNINDLNNSTI